MDITLLFLFVAVAQHSTTIHPTEQDLQMTLIVSRTGCSTKRVALDIILDDLGESHVNHLAISVRIHERIFGLQVAIGHGFQRQMLQGEDFAGGVKLGLSYSSMLYVSRVVITCETYAALAFDSSAHTDDNNNATTQRT
mgnify:CR=1 FL=1|jgi:hypothetical protein